MEDDSKYDVGKIQVLRGLEAVRKRPGMYIGGTDLFGLINYFVAPFNLLLAFKPSFIHTKVVENGYKIISDAQLRVFRSEDLILPFEDTSFSMGHGFEGPILAALSEFLEVKISQNNKTVKLAYRDGERCFSNFEEEISHVQSVEIYFNPDARIFDKRFVDSFIFQSYFQRLSYLFAGVEFKLTADAETKVFFSKNGISDLFQAFASPFQFMHTPIHIMGEKNGLKLELIFAFHSWTKNRSIAFINRSRTAQCGTHETGLESAFKHLSENLVSKNLPNGVLAISSMFYEDVQFEGCIRQAVKNEELHGLVKEIVIEKTIEFVRANRDLEEQLKRIQLFQFPMMFFKGENPTF